MRTSCARRRRRSVLERSGASTGFASPCFRMDPSIATSSALIWIPLPGGLPARSEQTLLAVPPRIGGVGRSDGPAPASAKVSSWRATAAARVGVCVAFEFLGFFDCPIRTPDAAARTVDGLEGVKLVLDSCHWHASGSGSLDRFPVERLAMVHLNDAPPKPPPQDRGCGSPAARAGRHPPRRADRRSCAPAAIEGHGASKPSILSTGRQNPRVVAQHGAAALDSLLSRES